MSLPRRFAVIVGAGPVGMMLANLLGAEGAEVLLLERRSTPSTVPRAIAYDAETLRLFAKAGLLEALEPTLERDVPVRYLNASGRTIMYLGPLAQPYGHSMLGTFYQPEMEAALADGLKRFPNIERRDSADVVALRQDSQGAHVSWREAGELHEVAADYVIGCDGGSSFVREAAGIGFGGQTFTERWLVVDCIGEGLGLREMQFFCDPARPALTLPVSRGRRRWEFLMLPGETEAELASEATVRRLIAGYAPADRSTIERALVYTFHARNADRYRNGRILLAGDAAHVNPPFAGQGLNGGFRDAQNLAWRLDMVRRGIAAPALLDSYEAERKPHVQKLTDHAIKLGETIMPTSRLKAALRDASLLGLRAIPAYRRFVETGGIIERPTLAGGVVRSGCKQAGQMLLQPCVTGPNGRRQPLDALMGPGWALVGTGVSPAATLHQADLALAERLRARLVHLQPGDAPALEQQLGQGRITLVRPDRYIADVLKPGTGPALAWLAAALSLAPEAALIADVPADQRMAPSPSPTAKAQDLAFVMFARPDLDRMELFLGDFGLRRVERRADRLVMRAARGPGPAHISWQAPQPAFLGLALRVRDEADLAALARLPGASAVEPLDLPGGGLHVRLTDPAGLQVWAVTAQATLADDPVRSPMPFNGASEKPRFNNASRPPAGPAKVLRIGHCAIGAVDFFATTRWYMEHFGLIPSDVQCLSDNSPALCFMRCDRGSDPADHHTVVVAQNVTNGFSHAAFEVVDLDDIAMGQEHLLSRGWTHAWGVGRHILGSQIFDYWRDPLGDKLEHFADGDVFDANVPTGWSRLDSGGIYMWGPPIPKDFERPRLTPGLVWKAIHNIRQSRELDLPRVRRLMAAISSPPRPWTK